MWISWRSLGSRYAVALILTLALLLPAAATLAQTPAPATDQFQRVWNRTDLPVAEGLADRTWMWGPALSGALRERYDDSPGQQRLVQYFDKARMEINDHGAVDDGLWYVTNGLLAVELIMGRVQVAEHVYETALPSELNVAGDQGFPNGPSYATFNRFLGLPDYAQKPDDRGDALVAERIDRSGIVTSDDSLAAMAVRLSYYDDVTFHNIAAPFWEFMHSSGLIHENDAFVTGGLFPNPFYATGRPVTEPYWADVVVGGSEKLVLLQCFERRCLTYTPDNPEGWQVEAGNVGQHHYQWRYAQPPAVEGQLIFYRGIFNADLNRFVSDLYRVDIDGSGLLNLSADIDASVEGAVWSPDGSRIAFAAAGNLYVMDADGGNRQQLTNSGTDAMPTWSPDGSQLAFQRTLNNFVSHIFIINTDGSDERQLTDVPSADSPGSNPGLSHSSQPVWSPDGSQIAFSSQNRSMPGTTVSGIHIVDADGDNLRELVPPVAYYVRPLWSPDGAWLVFSRPQLHGRELWGSGLYMVDPAVEAPILLTVAGDDASYPSGAVWAPHDNLLALSLTPIEHFNGGTRGLHLLDPATGEQTQITHTGSAPSWSPDGQYLAFSFGINPTNIAITDLTGRTQWLVVENGQQPQWRPGTFVEGTGSREQGTGGQGARSN